MGFLSRWSRSAGTEIRLRSPLDALLLFGRMLSSLPHERVAVAYLTATAALIEIAIVAEGGDAAAVLPVSVILRGAIARDAPAFIVAHNHPSGDATPSIADIKATRMLAAGAVTMGLTLVDHVVLAGEDARSFRVMGLM